MDNELIEAITRISTNIDWIKIQAEKTTEHLSQINGAIVQNRLDIETAKANDRWLWRVMTIVIVGLIGFILQYFLR